MISAMASRSRPARCLTRPTSSESESRARDERLVFMMCLYHAVFRARETAVDARAGAETSPGVALRARERAAAFWRAAEGILARAGRSESHCSRKRVKSLF